MLRAITLTVVGLAVLGVTPCVARLEQQVHQHKREHQHQQQVQHQHQHERQHRHRHRDRRNQQAQKDVNDDKSATDVEQEAVVVDAPQAIEYTLRVCNGYAAKEPIMILKDPSTTITEDPIDYKKCADLTMQLQEGDELLFNVGDKQVGAFTASGLPESKLPLLLVVYRRSRYLQSAAFESHIYADSPISQVACIDTFQGDLENSMQIRRGNGKPVDVTFGSIAYVMTPGDYDIFLTGKGTPPRPGGPSGWFNKPVQRAMNVTIKPDTTYVAMRVGLEDSEFPEELVMLGGAAAARLGAVAFLAVLARILRLA